MNSNQESQCSVTSGGEMFRRPPWLAYTFAAVTLGCLSGGSFLTFLLPETSDWLIPIGLICVMIAVPWLIICAFLPKPRSAPILLVTLLMFYVPTLPERENSNWFLRLGFRIHVSPVERYLANCRRVEFTEDGSTRAIGWCEGREVGSALNVALTAVIYDPAGGLLKPEEQRTPEWNRAFSKVTGGDDFPATLSGIIPLFRDFYLIHLSYA